MLVVEVDMPTPDEAAAALAELEAGQQDVSTAGYVDPHGGPI